MCTAKLYGHSTGTVLSVDARTKTKCWKVRQLTDNGYQDLQHHWLTHDRYLKRMSDTICTTTTRTSQQDCQYYSLLWVWVATTIIILSAQLKVTFTVNILVSLCELYNSRRALCCQFSAVDAYKYYDTKTLCPKLLGFFRAKKSSARLSWEGK